MIFISSLAYGEPCEKIDFNLSKENIAKLIPIIAKQLHVKNIDILKSFNMGNWHIFYVDTHESDEVFLFYSNDPLSSQYITLWSGAATSDEEQKIKDWVIKNVPGIPNQLANCFSWYVTKNR
jgi:hypothetical protein